MIENLNVLDYDYFFQITDALLAEDLSTLMVLFDQIVRKGFESDVFINGLAEHLRNVLVCKDESTLALLETGDSLRERYRRQSQVAPASFLLTALNLCNDCDINFKMARQKRLHVEMALIKMCHINSAIKAAGATNTAGIPEKKTPDGNLTPVPAPQKPVHPPIAPPVHSGNASPLDKDAISTLTSEIKLGLKRADKISLDLSAFDKAVKIEQAEMAQRGVNGLLDRKSVV